MKTTQWLVVSAALAIGTAVPAVAATTDPEVLIYRFPGVRDSPALEVATVFHCMNFSGADETVRFVTRSGGGTLFTNVPVTIAHLATRTVSTHFVSVYQGATDLQTGVVGQGTTAIAATSINVICAGEVIDATAGKPIGIARHGIRFNPAPGSQE